MTTNVMTDDRVSRRRYERERIARLEAERLLEGRALALYEANGMLQRQASMLEETVQRRTEELSAAKLAAEAASDAKSAFLAMISHEIRTPLNGVLGMATALSDTALEAAQKDMVEVILSSGNGLLALLNDVLDLSKIEASRLVLENIPFDPSALIEGVAALHRATAVEKGLYLFVANSLPAGLWVGDPNRLRQVVSNLLSNAVKFTSDGGVRLDLRMTAGLLEAVVTDTGPGVPKDKRDRLFQAFSQADESITRQFGGTGLGLAISQRICRMMGGDLVYREVPSGGGCFAATVQLCPAESSHPPNEDCTDDDLRVLSLKRWRVLAAEDSATNRKVLELLLRQHKLDLEMVGNGAEAIERHRENPFDLILMDVNMPVMDGLTASQRIREEEERTGRHRVPIIALTANAMTHEVATYSKYGVDDHVAKPIQRNVLTKAMALHLGPSQPSD